jgi:SCY1-like protein 1
VKDSAEKDIFFKQLPGQLPHIPKPVAQKKLLPQLSQALQFGGAPASALGACHLLGFEIDNQYSAEALPLHC